MRSDVIKSGIERSPHRSLFKAMGFTDEEIKRPLIGVANSKSEIIPGHIHLDTIAEAEASLLREVAAAESPARATGVRIG